MLLRATSQSYDGWTGKAAIDARHPASSHGRPLLLIEGEPVGPVEADWAGYEILDATFAERALLQQGGYHFDLEIAYA